MTKKRFTDAAVDALAEFIYETRRQQLLALELNVAERTFGEKTARAISTLLCFRSPWCLTTAYHADLREQAREILTELDTLGLIHDAAKHR